MDATLGEKRCARTSSSMTTMLDGDDIGKRTKGIRHNGIIQSFAAESRRPLSGFILGRLGSGISSPFEIQARLL
jgi:hypothetical protein